MRMTLSSTRLTCLFLFVLGFGCLTTRAAQQPPGSSNRALAVHDLNRSFSTNSNPNGAWRYGWKQKLDGELTLLTFPKRSVNDESGDTFAWQLSENESPGIGISTHDGPTPPDSKTRPMVLLEPGQNGAPENFAVARFTVPQGAAGVYRIECSIGHKDSARAGDGEFRVLRTGRPIYELSTINSREIRFTNVLALTEGATVDFVVGRGR